MKEIEKVEKSLREKIDNVMDCFDFNKVHEVMKFLNWRWAFCDGENGIPEEYELRQAARKRLNEVVDCYIKAKMKGENTQVFLSSTGGFTAEIIYDTLRLYFYVDEWNEENILDLLEDEI